ncbi:MAG: radical SAM protein [Clostridia bacterium]|nr:radical SAM protein [Clostridia bacterium]
MDLAESVKNKAIRAAANAFIDRTVDSLANDPEGGIRRLVDKAGKLNSLGLYPPKYLDAIRNAAADPDNVYMRMAERWVREVDPEVLKQLLRSLGVEAGYFGTKTARRNREVLKCNIPWLILLDPTSACNLKCKGCWAAEYGYRQSLSIEEMRSVINQGRELGVHVYMYTGGEPLIRKKDIITLCREFRDCAFLSFTNATLIDDAFCAEMKDVGNLVLALSIEGSQKSNDSRRGEGAYEATRNAMLLLKKHRLFYGVSVCYTRENLESVTNDDFLDMLVSDGVKFGMYFNYMPVGAGADKELIPTPQQRKYMYYWLRRVRNAKSGKQLLVMDFQDDGEYVGGCIAGGRNYFHINSSGDMEPCVFIHYSDSNIRSKTILEALKSPLFMSYYKGQPFNDNHLRPCPMLENPDKLCEIIERTGAKSTELIEPEDVKSLTDKCRDFAAAWESVADEIWAENPHPDPHTSYYRDNHQV